MRSPPDHPITSADLAVITRQLEAYKALRDYCGRLCDRDDFLFGRAAREELMELLIVCALADFA